MSADNGGPAFPKAGLDPWNKAQSVHTGMTLRDYFAAKAMPNLMSLCMDGDSAWDHDTVAQNAYALADAMLAEREKP